ncbi:ferrochelatase, partial [Micromonospora sp. CPCC 205371]|nr:ferrochelatase [Micromonospora sp. CPCC 205371]
GPGAGAAWTEQRADEVGARREGRQRPSGPGTRASGASASQHGGLYEKQLNETAALVAALGAPDLPWDLVWQSRSGPPHVPWLEPDVNDHLRALADKGVTGVVVSPIGFVSDHLEVIWDLDNEAADTARRLGMAYARAGTPGTDPRFVAMVRDLVRERVGAGTLPAQGTCQTGCCISKGGRS